MMSFGYNKGQMQTENYINLQLSGAMVTTAQARIIKAKSLWTLQLPTLSTDSAISSSSISATLPSTITIKNEVSQLCKISNNGSITTGIVTISPNNGIVITLLAGGNFLGPVTVSAICVSFFSN